MLQARYRAARDVSFISLPSVLTGSFDLQKWQERADRLSAKLKTWPGIIAFYVGRAYVVGVTSWLWAGEAGQVALGITALNLLVYTGWCVPRLRPVMQRHFAHDPLSGKTYTMLTSMFR